MIFFIFLSSVICYISFDSQSSDVFNFADSVDCTNGAQFTEQITFSGIFKNIPQIIIVDSWYYMVTWQQVEFTIVIPQDKITTTNFKITLACPQADEMHRMGFRWAAIDDQRIQVITDLVNTSSISSSKTYTYDLQNPNFSQGFMSILSFGEKNAMNFNLAIDSITYNKVSIKFSTTDDNVISVGFQAILGTPEALNISDIINWKITASTFYYSDTLTVSPGYKLMLPICGFQFLFVHSFSFQFVYNDNSATTGQITYIYKTNWDIPFLRISFREVWFNTLNTKKLYPLLCKKARVSSYYDMKSLTNPLYSLYFVELSQTFDSTTGTKYILINNTIKKLNMKFSFKCSSTKKVQSKLMKCTSCTPSHHIIKQNCYGGMNTMVINTQFYQADSVNKLLLIKTNSTGFSITQTVYNQESATYTLVDVSIGLI